MKNWTAKQVTSAAGVACLGVFLLAWLIWWWNQPPQMGEDKEVAKAVDALFTAVTARDEKLLGQCERRLHGYKEDGKLATKAADYLDGIIHKARAGRWQPAAERLYDFMKVQRRDGSGAERKKPRSHPRLAKK